jgi:hypothetical protein
VTDAGDDTLERLLRLVPYFRDLDRVSLARLAGALERIDVKADTEITREGTEATSSSSWGKALIRPRSSYSAIRAPER